MTSDGLITAQEGVTLEEAKHTSGQGQKRKASYCR